VSAAPDYLESSCAAEELIGCLLATPIVVIVIEYNPRAGLHVRGDAL
jgi:hypothetical protein